MRIIELSCDLGEASDAAGRAAEAEIWAMVGAANVACGGHAGDAASMREAVERAARYGVRLGAHPSYPDREGFGRQRMTIAPERLRASLVEQMEALRAAAGSAGVPLERAKAHGALYNEAVHDEALAEIVVDAIEAVDARIAIVAQPHSRMIAAARRRGLPTIREAFADRRYAPDGSLVPRSDPRALLLNPADAAAQAVLLAAEHRARTSVGKVAVEFETLCVHGDMARAVERLVGIRAALAEAGFELARRSAAFRGETIE